MSNLSDEIQRRVALARQLDQEQREERERQAAEQAERRARGKKRADELNQEIRAKFMEAAAASGGAMRYEPRGSGTGTNFHALEWQAPPPQRALRVAVRLADCTIECHSTPSGFQSGIDRGDVLGFDSGRIDGMILDLADQEAWSRGA